MNESDIKTLKIGISTIAELLEEGRLINSGHEDIMPIVWSVITDCQDILKA